jgi:hypothetical protein
MRRSGHTESRRKKAQHAEARKSLILSLNGDSPRLGLVDFYTAICIVVRPEEKRRRIQIGEEKMRQLR